MTDYEAAKRAEGFDLRDVVREAVLPQTPKLGHLADAHPRLKLADYVVDGAPAVPPAVHRSHLEHDFPMYLNNELGDCGEAMTLHGIEAFHLDAGTAVPSFADGDAEKLYEEVGGYVPGKPATDKGTNNETLVNYWQNTGVACAAENGNVHKIVASMFVDPQDVELNERAIWEFVVLFRAIALPETAQGQKEWTVTEPQLQGPAAPGSWGGHDIPYFSYDGQRYRCATWGTELLLTYQFDADYATQGFVAITEEMLNNTGVSPAGIDWDKLTSDINAMGS